MAKKFKIFYEKFKPKEITIHNSKLFWKLRDLNPYLGKIDWDEYRGKWHELIMPHVPNFRPINYSNDSKRHQIELSNELMVVTIKRED